MTDITPLRIGILGAAKIAPGALVAPCKATGVAVAYAIAARDRVRAEAFAAEHGVERVLDSYAALIADPEVDAVYNALPPALHADLTIQALRAGKPVLCEKPFAMTASEARAMVAAARETGVMLMEAFHYRYHPMFARLLEIVRGGSLGALKRIEAVFNVPIPEAPGEIRYDDGLGGGALMDLGTYPVHWCRTVAGSEPTVVSASADLTGGAVDVVSRAELAFAGGLTAGLSCSMAEGPAIRLVIEGARGTLTATNPLAPQMGHLLEGPDGLRETFTREPTYDFQLRAFVEAVQSGVEPATSGEDSVAQMALLDQIRRISREAA